VYLPLRLSCGCKVWERLTWFCRQRLGKRLSSTVSSPKGLYLGVVAVRPVPFSSFIIYHLASYCQLVHQQLSIFVLLGAVIGRSTLSVYHFHT